MDKEILNELVPNYYSTPLYDRYFSNSTLRLMLIDRNLIFKNRTLLFILFFSVIAKRLSFGQNSNVSYQAPAKKMGTLYFSWGYNRDSYSRSDIHFENKKTDNYDFTFKSATARDRPSMERFWQPSRLTIPQYDLHIGYLFSDKHDLGIEIGWNHLKYVMNDNQIVFVHGNIRGKAINKDTLVTPDFVRFEHTDGNNYLLFNLVKKKRLLGNRTFQASAIGKLGVGPLISYSHSKMFGSYGQGPFRYEGWVTGISLGIRLNIYKYLFIQTDVQGAFADYTSIKLAADKQGRATQQFYSLQYMGSAGINVPLHL